MPVPPQFHTRNHHHSEAGYGLLDYSAFPHIVELVVKYADWSTRLAFRRTCKSLQEATDDEHFWKSINVEIDTYWDDVADQQHPETGIIDIFAQDTEYWPFTNPAMYSLRWPDDENFNAASLRAISKAKVVDLAARADICYRQCSDLSQDAIDMVTKALTSMCGIRGRDIPVLRVEQALPTPVITGGVHTMIKFEWAYRNRPVPSPLNIPNVARAVLHVRFADYYFNLDFDQLGSSPTTVLERLPTPPPVNRSVEVPQLVVIFSDFPSWPTGFWHYYWDNGKLGWANHLFQTLIYDCHRSVTMVGALALPPIALGFQTPFASSKQYQDAIVETASSMAEEWRDGSLEHHRGWTQALGKATIDNISFLTHEEYREIVGVEQYTMETVLP